MQYQYLFVVVDFGHLISCVMLSRYYFSNRLEPQVTI